MKAEVLAWCRKEALFEPGDRVICAVSGGADSMALLWCLKSLEESLGITVSAAHFNHQLRGEESDRDEAYVREFCEARQLPCFFGAGDVRAYAAQTGRSLEDAARQMRYEFLLSLPGEKIATAHTAEDNTETVLLHLLRGSGLRGLCGIPVKRGKIVRPLLSVTKRELTEELTAAGISWREDSTNAEDNCLRNRLRHRVVPLLKEETPDLARRLTVQSELLRQEDAYLDEQAAACVQPEEDGFLIRPLLDAHPVLRRRALRQILRSYLPQDVSLAHIAAVEALLTNPSPSAQLSLPGGLLVRKCYHRLTVSPRPEKTFPETPVQTPGVTQIRELGLEITCEFIKTLEKTVNSPFLFALKCDKIDDGQLCLRPRREGDRLCLGNGHSRTLKKLMIDLKIPRYRRKEMAVLAWGERVLAVVGIGAGQDVCAAPGESALVFHIKNKEQ